MFTQNLKRIYCFGMVLAFASSLATYAASTNEIRRKLSLQDCISLALAHNLDVKVARFEPEIARQNVSAAYGIYEPTFEIADTHRYSASPGGIDEQNRPFPGTTTERDAYRAGIIGFLPTGLSLDLGADLSGRKGL